MYTNQFVSKCHVIFPQLELAGPEQASLWVATTDSTIRNWVSIANYSHPVALVIVRFWPKTNRSFGAKFLSLFVQSPMPVYMKVPNMRHSLFYLDRVRTGPGKPGKSWNLIICIPGLESHGIFVRVMESHGI